MISIGMISARPEAHYSWFFESLRLQTGLGEVGQIILIDFFAQPCDAWTQADVDKRYHQVMEIANHNGFYNLTEWHPPKPTIWAGPSRITKQNWWHASAARNSVFCYAKHEFVACLDDRCVLAATWLDAMREAQEKSYAIAGTYQKRTGLKVTDGIVTHAGIITGHDSRYAHTAGNKYKCNGSWLFGCNFGLPLEWALEVGGFAEDYCDGISMEDVIFGTVLEHSGKPIFFDPRASIIEDRTTGELGTPMVRSDKGVSPKDKSHKLLEVFAGAKDSKNSFNLRAQREAIQSGGDFPKPTAQHFDWYDNQPIRGL